MAKRSLRTPGERPAPTPPQTPAPAAVPRPASSASPEASARKPRRKPAVDAVPELVDTRRPESAEPVPAPVAAEPAVPPAVPVRGRKRAPAPVAATETPITPVTRPVRTKAKPAAASNGDAPVPATRAARKPTTPAKPKVVAQPKTKVAAPVMESTAPVEPVVPASSLASGSADAVLEVPELEVPELEVAVVAAAPVEEQVAEALLTPIVVPAVNEPRASGEVEPGASRSLRILMVASEVVPFSKTGGLADVAGALPGALGRLGHQVVVATPRYRGIAIEGEPLASFELAIGPERFKTRLYARPIGDNAVAWLVDIPALYDRDGLYGSGGQDHPDNPLRFAALARAALDGALATGFAPDLVHAHDWQAGLAPVYLRTRYAGDPVLGGVPSVLTIHNIAYKGLFDPRWLPALDLGWDLLSPQALEYWGHISFLKAGIQFSEKVTTVSRKYADEILTADFAYGFEGILQARRADLVGILNGVDTETWDPGNDPHIPRPYSADALEGKRDAKRALLQAFGLPADEAALGVPLVGMVSRMIEQKGVDLIAAVADELPQLGCRFVILGTGEPRFEEMWRTLSARYPDRISARIGFDEGLSHLLEAGSDLFLMPSRFEPCGLNQMYSLRYGTLPLVRATGGLDDTVQNYDPYSGEGNGFKFWEPSGAALLGTLRWALRVYEHPEVWQRLQRRAMAADFSWARSAASYVEVYDAALARVGRAHVPA